MISKRITNIFRMASVQIWGKQANKFQANYNKEAKDIINHPQRWKIVKISNLLYKEDNRGLETGKMLALQHSRSLFNSSDEDTNRISMLSLEEIENNLKNTGSACGCTDGCCGYCYPGA